MAKPTAIVAKDGTVSWRVQFRLNGKPTQRTFINLKGAQEFGALKDRIGAKAAVEISDARATNTNVITLGDWVAKYLDPASGLLTGVEPGTRAEYARAAGKSFLPMLGPYPIDSITKVDVGRWVAWQEDQPSERRKGQKIAAKTVRNYHAILSAVMASAVAEGLRPDNPAYRTRLTRGQKKEATFLTKDELATILYFTPARHERFIHFLAGSGCRWGEATALTWGDLNLNANPVTVRIDKAWKKGATSSPILKHPKSSRAFRTISLDPDVVAALGTPGNPKDLIFPGQKGNHLWYSSFREITWVPTLQRAQDPQLCEQAGLTPITKNPTMHDLRHSHASWLIAGGAPLPFIQARLGHESITTTINVYGHLQPDAHHAMADIIGTTLSGVRTLREVPARGKVLEIEAEID